MIITQAPANELAQRYRRLKPTPKLLMRLKSLLYFASEPPAFLECVRRVHNRAPSNEAWTQSLATTFVNGGYKMSALVQAVVSSRAYRASNNFTSTEWRKEMGQ